MEPKRTDDLYELAPEAQARRNTPRVVQPTAKPAASVAVSQGSRPLDYRAPQPADDGETIRNIHMPLWFLVGGLAIELAVTFFRSRTWNDAAVAVTLGLFARTALMMVAMLIAARARQIDLGSLSLALLKLAAVAVAPSAIVTLAEPILWIIPFGWVIGWVVVFALHYALLGAFFDLDESDTWYCVMVMFIVAVVTHFGLMALSAYL